MSDKVIGGELKPNLKFDYVPIKEINIGDQHPDWLRTETFIQIVSQLLKDDDVKKAGGFMIIRPKNYNGAVPFLYTKDSITKYSPKHYDLSCMNGNVYGIQNLKGYFQAQIHDQKCKYVKSQLFKWNDKTIYENNKTIKQQFELNQSRKKSQKKSKKKQKKPKSNPLQFEIVSNDNGELMTQTQSGRIIKIKKPPDTYDKLNRYLGDNSPSPSPTPPSPPTKKRKLNNDGHKAKYQYPFEYEEAMPEPIADNDDTDAIDFKVQPRAAYTGNHCKNSTANNSYNYYDNYYVPAQKHINRGFAIVIQQTERKEKEAMSSFWDIDAFEKRMENGSLYDNATAEEIPLIFCDNICRRMSSVQYGIIDEDSVYHFESALQLSHLSRYGPFSAFKKEEIMLGVESPYVYVGQQDTFFAFHSEDMNLFAVNHLLWGNNKIWYCIHPAHHSRVMPFIRAQYNSDGGDHCETPLQHKIYWFDPYILLSMGIPVYFIRQEPGDIVVTPPGGIHGGLNTGPNMAESINFMTYDIDTCWNVCLSAMLFYCQNFQCNACISHAFIDINRLAQRLREKDEEIDENVVAKPLEIAPIPSIPKYSNADKIISRSFTWKNRMTLKSRYMNSFEFKTFQNALYENMIYPYYERKDNIIFPVKYNGQFKYLKDELIFTPIYNILFINHSHIKAKYVKLKYVLRQYGVCDNEWNKETKFEEKSIRLKLRNYEDIIFSYSNSLNSKNMIRSKERRKKNKSKRVIIDSDTESD